MTVLREPIEKLIKVILVRCDGIPRIALLGKDVLKERFLFIHKGTLFGLFYKAFAAVSRKTIPPPDATAEHMRLSLSLPCGEPRV